MATFEEINILLEYFPEEGILKWRSDRNSSTKKGNIAGSLNACGYVHVKVLGKTYIGHRLIWLLYYGEWPSGQIDHINRIKNDNRICNLRIASPSENAKNIGIRLNNTSGYTGVRWHKEKVRWVASITKDDKTHYLGSFRDKELAKEAYDKASLELFSNINGGI